MVKIKFKLEGGELPSYATKGAAGFDIKTSIKEPYVINPGQTCLLPTGLKVEVPKGYELQIRSRSGLALKHGLIILNAPGTIDSDYRGEIGLILHNTNDKALKILPGSRLGQGVLKKSERAELEVVKKFSKSERGEGGYGSTGV